MSNMVSHPAHYNQGGIECIDAIKAATVGKTGVEAFCVGNAIKYLWRYEEKNGLQDVEKAKWYIERLISELESSNNGGEDVQYYDCGLDTPQDFNDDEADCLNCIHWDKDLREEPCYRCKNTFILGSKDYHSRQLFFEPKAISK